MDLLRNRWTYPLLGYSPMLSLLCCTSSHASPSILCSAILAATFLPDCVVLLVSVYFCLLSVLTYSFFTTRVGSSLSVGSILLVGAVHFLFCVRLAWVYCYHDFFSVWFSLASSSFYLDAYLRYYYVSMVITIFLSSREVVFFSSAGYFTRLSSLFSLFCFVQVTATITRQHMLSHSSEREFFSL